MPVTCPWQSHSSASSMTIFSSRPNAALQAARKKRNLRSYERVGIVSDAEAVEMRDLAAAIRRKVLTWLRKEHPHLVRLLR